MPMKEALSASLTERAGRIGLIVFAVIVLGRSNGHAMHRPARPGQFIGDVGLEPHKPLHCWRDEQRFCWRSPAFPCILPGSGLYLWKAPVFSALSKGFTTAAFIMFLLAFIRNVASVKKGLGEEPLSLELAADPCRQFAGQSHSYGVCYTRFHLVTHRYSSTRKAQQFDGSLGRLLFCVVPIVLAISLSRIMAAVRATDPPARFFYISSISLPSTTPLAAGHRHLGG